MKYNHPVSSFIYYNNNYYIVTQEYNRMKIKTFNNSINIFNTCKIEFCMKINIFFTGNVKFYVYFIFN